MSIETLAIIAHARSWSRRVSAMMIAMIRIEIGGLLEGHSKLKIELILSEVFAKLYGLAGNCVYAKFQFLDKKKLHFNIFELHTSQVIGWRKRFIDQF